MKKVGITFFALGTVFFLSNLLNIKALTQSGIVESLANATGGIPSDILGGFGCIFFFVSLLLFLVICIASFVIMFHVSLISFYVLLKMGSQPSVGYTRWMGLISRGTLNHPTGLGLINIGTGGRGLGTA